MTDRIDPLAVLDSVIQRSGHVLAHDVVQARADFAALVKAAIVATDEVLHDGASSRAACDRLIAALAPFNREGA